MSVFKRPSVRRGILWAGIVLVVLALPWLTTDYRLYQLTLAAAFAITILGLNILTGYNGQFSLGHGAFFAVGAYTTAVLMDRWDIPYWMTIPAGGMLAGVLGFLFGFPALRLSGLYLALATLALAVSVPQVLKKWESVTGGVQGIVLPFTRPPSSLDLTPEQWLFYVAAAWGLVLYLFAWSLLRTRVGRAFVAIRDSEVAAAASGISLTRYKTLAFGISAFYAGVGGSLSALAVAFVAPDSFPLTLSITLVVGMVIGGVGSILGALLGGLVVQFLPVYAQDISQAAPGVIYGIVLLLFMYLMPFGIVGFVRKLWNRALSLTRQAAPAPQTAAAAVARGGATPESGKEVRSSER